MIIVKLKGGLGNQMFQYATGKALALKNNTKLKLDLSFLKRMGKGYVLRNFKKNEPINYELSFFNINNNFAIKKEIPIFERPKYKYIYYFYKTLYRHINIKNYFIEKKFSFNSELLEIKSGYIEGYFQTEKYFKDYRNEIKEDFNFKIPPSSKNKEIINVINKCNSVSIHVRRGDYINKNLNKVYGNCDLKYYKKAIDIIKEKINNPIFFFFSDDIEWVKKNLQINNKSYYIDWNNNNTCYEDMRLMTLCKHNIIANSTFSWWGAWLNNYKEKIIIAPKKWLNNTKINYSDIIPNSWIKI